MYIFYTFAIIRYFLYSFSGRKGLTFNPLLPVAVADVEQRPLPEQYSARVVQERFDNEGLQLVTDENGIGEFQPDLLFFRTHGNLWQRTEHSNVYSVIFDHSWRESGHAYSSIKINLKLSGTYDMNGELITTPGEKGIYIDQFS